ncbi:hypothetical protein FVR03_01610 [Pontibacter qinzhouensis]|uniref:Uncharacterized protein n=1 Tax=Pontibacter qinzhouensis TaxID=2603253 RepID=A0A5C8KEQ6_9BACT|nr:hypothetical protein [Pontibacter qinzhouensis]TXK52144.1 hypothetical protein FVR03_01610 [Pontibacter qinzhouensis]
MKNAITKTVCALSIVLGTGMSAKAQAPEPGKGSWVVETNLTQKNYSIVRFYNQHGQQIYEEKLQGVYLDVTKAKTRKMLNKTLAHVSSNTVIAGQYFKNTLPDDRLAKW